MTNHVVEEVGDVYCTIKVYGTRDPTGWENNSIFLWFVDDCLTLATTEEVDAKTLTQIIMSKLTKAALRTDKISSQV